ncbi:MAG: LacI family transcriptional regulator, partial [Chloroflexota bacterium]|nr:LacI family transcriptional regulator [Chloroflexota bacterium]
MPSAKRTTRIEVARAAGVSEYTVSVVLNDPWYGRVGAETRERVRSIAAALGYRPQASGRALRLGRTELIAYVSTPELLHHVGSYHGALLPALLSAANDAGYELAIVGDDREEALLQRLRRAVQSGRFDGLILGQPHLDDPVLDLLRHAGLPFVLAAEHPHGSLCQVVRDGYAMAADVAARLVAAGHRRVGLAGADPAWRRQWFNQRRRQGLQGTLAPQGELIDLPVDLAEGIRQARRAGVTAIVAGTDADAVQIVGAALAAGLAVPRDLSVVSLYAVCAPAATAPGAPSLASLCVEPSDVAREAVRALATLVAGEALHASRITLPYWWTAGQSLAPPPIR